MLWHNFKQLRRRNQASMETESMTFVFPVRCPTNWAAKPFTLGAGQIVGATCQRKERAKIDEANMKC